MPQVESPGLQGRKCMLQNWQSLQLSLLNNKKPNHHSGQQAKLNQEMINYLRKLTRKHSNPP